MSNASTIVVGSLLGSSPVTAFVESSTRIREGGRTGMTALTVAAPENMFDDEGHETLSIFHSSLSSPFGILVLSLK
ncbi:hypothetical protein PVL29_007474 [Vitis rotundifolia]|uniref:Uncharacterized protein n=1 Tax=Vitis rotundifolia TaxID=103349 RepID=A0AA39A0Q1_VITRO|nr:hypothetical protein PVL29_007474 [Vitis rotundifolia]